MQAIGETSLSKELYRLPRMAGSSTGVTLLYVTDNCMISWHRNAFVTFIIPLYNVLFPVFWSSNHILHVKWIVPTLTQKTFSSQSSHIEPKYFFWGLLVWKQRTSGVILWMDFTIGWDHIDKKSNQIKSYLCCSSSVVTLQQITCFIDYFQGKWS